MPANCTSFNLSKLSLALLVLLTVVLPSQAATFPDEPLQTSASRPPANIMFILDDSGSMEFDYMPDNLASGIFNRSNHWINSLAYDPQRLYYPWRNHDGTMMSGGMSYGSVFSHDSLLSDTRSLWSDTQVFYYPKTSSVPRGSTTKSDYYEYTIYRNSGGDRYTRCEWRSSGGGSYSSNCKNDAAALPVATRSMTDELNNYATWYSYHRTRMKVAKAGVTESFSQLDPNLRVGYDSIWNRNPMNIPVSSDNGLFRGANKINWFNHVIQANGNGGTPLHGALVRAGEYFKRPDASGPWGPESGANQFSCRQNFAIMTTDGYWNNDDGYTLNLGNSDSTNGLMITAANGDKYQYTPKRPFMDTGTDTLADVAMNYWKNDLRLDLSNNVSASVANPAFWQHMSMFGISIGLSGTLNPLIDLPALTNGSKVWPDPWRLTTNGNRSWGNESPRRIDDLWHATVNGRGTFTVANNPTEINKGVKDALSSIQKTLASGSNVSTSSTSLQTDTRIFHATYYSGIWTGELAAFDISAAGIAQDPAWTASSTIKYAGRKVFTRDAGQGKVFPAGTQAARMVAGLTDVVATESALANYIKGDRSNEVSSGGKLRNRESVLGDIINSSPIYAADTDSIYVGANDGMLHSFDATTGKEHFAYVPAGLDFEKLGSLGSPTYSHRFFVDGQVAVSSSKQTPGKNYLVGALGRGGKGVFGLDVTTPTSFGVSNVLWDISSAPDADMGYVIGDILIATTASGHEVAIVPNGIDSTSGTAALYVVQLSNGQVLKKLDTGIRGNNGLSSPRGWDEDLDGDVDFIYAGDLLGNLWKFDLQGAGVADWKIANGAPIFRARSAGGSPQPITGGLALGKEAFGDRMWILFGTGRYISQLDITSSGTQTVYGIIDDSATTITRAQLKERDLKVVGTGPGGRALRALETHAPLPVGVQGWFIDLDEPYMGERVIERGFLSGRVLVLPSVVPIAGNPCDAAGRGFLNAFDAFTGTSVAANGVNHPYFDVGSDGSQDNDWLPSGSGKLPVASVETSVGMVTKPILVGELVVYGGSSGGKETEKVRLPPASPKRLSWRELFRD